MKTVLQKLDKTLKKQQILFKNFQTNPLESIEPFVDYEEGDNVENFKRGKEIIASGKVGCLIVAGGQGTRLKFDGPKGMYRVTKFKKKTLFQIFAEKTYYAGIEAGRKLPLSIMTSLQNLQIVNDYFRENNFFGLDEDQVFIFPQDELYLLDEEGNTFLDPSGKIAKGPNGNGSALRHFVESGVWQKIKSQGIEYINFVLIDNPLADPFDANLCGFLEKTGADVVIKCTKRLDSGEQVGTIAKHHGKVEVIEYSEFPKDEDVEKYPLINLSLFAFTMDFIKKIAQVDLPLHLAHKANSFLDKNGIEQRPKRPNSWKFEEFIFDVLPYAKSVKALKYLRETCFAPLKNAVGRDSIETVQKALQTIDYQTFSKISAQQLADENFELSQEFYYPTAKFIKEWQGKKIPNLNYIS